MHSTSADRKPSDVTREMIHAFEHFYDPSNKRPLRHRAASEDGYGAYEISIYAGFRDDFRSLFDFFVNLPGTNKLQGLLSFTWETLKPHTSIDEFLEFQGSAMRSLLELVGSHEHIQEGYIVSEERGRLDEFTTWSRIHWLFATERSFVSVDYYETVLH